MIILNGEPGMCRRTVEVPVPGRGPHIEGFLFTHEKRPRVPNPLPNRILSRFGCVEQLHPGHRRSNRNIRIAETVGIRGGYPRCIQGLPAAKELPAHIKTARRRRKNAADEKNRPVTPMQEIQISPSVQDNPLQSAFLEPLPACRPEVRNISN